MRKIPCNSNCSRRSESCHINCEDYKKYKQQLEEEKQKINEEKNIENDFKAFRHEMKTIAIREGRTKWTK